MDRRWLTVALACSLPALACEPSGSVSPHAAQPAALAASDRGDAQPTLAGLDIEDIADDIDDDGDGFRGERDRCPDEAGIAPDGCPLRDSDGDGLLDPDDACPAQCETVNGFEDEDGCADTIPADLQAVLGRIDGLEFEFAKPTIREPSFARLDEIVAVLQRYPEVDLRIEGHRDNKGDSRLDRVRITQKRADSVREYLVAHGVAADRLETIGYGEDRPIDTNATAEGRGRNRRVELVLAAPTTDVECGA